MKRFALTAASLALALSGCAQQKGAVPNSSQDARLAGLESGFARFQEQQRARDADIDFKLREIAARLDSLSQGKAPASRAQARAQAGAQAGERTPASAAPMAQTRTRQPIVAGQVIPYSSLVQPQATSGQAAAQPGAAPAQQGMTPPGQTPGQAGATAASPVAPAATPPGVGQTGRQPVPVAPQPQSANQFQAGQPQTGQARAAQPVAPVQQAQPGMAQGQAAPLPLPFNPPVVTLGDPSRFMTPAPAAPMAQTSSRQPMPVDAPRKGRAARTPQAFAQASSTAAPSATGASAVAAPVPATPQSPPAAQSPAPDMQEQQLYTEALRAVSANRNDEGRRKFNDFLARFPASAKTPEALYWIGESYMGDKSFNQAVLSFKEVTTRFPKDPKSAEALWRIADAYERLGDKANATFHLKLLVDEYPASEVTGKARQKLKQLGQ